MHCIAYRRENIYLLLGRYLDLAFFYIIVSLALGVTTGHTVLARALSCQLGATLRTRTGTTHLCIPIPLVWLFRGPLSPIRIPSVRFGPIALPLSISISSVPFFGLVRIARIGSGAFRVVFLVLVLISLSVPGKLGLVLVDLHARGLALARAFFHLFTEFLLLDQLYACAHVG